MPSLKTTFAAILAIGAIVPAFADVEPVGCYDNAGDLASYGPNTYQTQGLCLNQCTADGKAVWAVTKGSTCYCGDAIPSDGKVDISQCNRTCQGYGQSCGGDTTWLFGYTGLVPSDTPKPSTTTSRSSSKTDVAIQTTVVIQSPATVTATPSTKSGSGHGTSKAGIAAGVVVGVIAVIAIGVGAFLVVRRNRRHQAEEEYRAAVAAKEFTASIRKPVPDSRLDPVMLQHRLSDGSIADNQDFSRRILKVTNPDA